MTSPVSWWARTERPPASVTAASSVAQPGGW